MKKSIFAILILFSLFFLMVAGGYAYEKNSHTSDDSIFTQWAITYGDVNENHLDDISRTSDGGYIVTAWVEDPANIDWDTWIFKLNSVGAIVWQQSFSSNSIDNELGKIKQTSDGGYIAAGSTVVLASSNLDGWIVKLDSNGSVVWQKKYGGSDYDQFYSIKETKDGGFIAVGNTRSFGAGSSDIWVIKLSNEGNIQWQKTYGGNDYDAGLEIAETSDNGYIIAGITESFGAGGIDFWIMKLTSNGATSWQKTYGGGLDDYVYTILETGNGGYIIGGNYQTSVGKEMGWILKLNGDGTINWQKTYGGNEDNKDDYVQSIVDAGNGEYLVAGSTETFGAGLADAWLFKVDGDGDVLWEKTYGGSNREYGRVVESTGGNILFAGKTRSFGEGDFDLWILKLNNLGEIADCSAIGNSSMVVSNTSVSAATTTITAQDSSASPVAVTGPLTSTSLQGQQVCWAEITPYKTYLPLILDQ